MDDRSTDGISPISSLRPGEGNDGVAGPERTHSAGIGQNSRGVGPEAPGVDCKPAGRIEARGCPSGVGACSERPVRLERANTYGSLVYQGAGLRPKPISESESDRN